MQINVATTPKKYSYPEYRELIFELAEKNTCTGPDKTAERTEATKLNAQRVKRIDKTVVVNTELDTLVISINKRWNWTVLMESWCGDGAQNIPVIAKVASLNDKIELRIILRDENPEIMDRYLTNGSRSIPILICTDVQSGQVLGTWGPRPERISEMGKEFKKVNPGVTHDEFVKNLHLWYARDKTESLQMDLLRKIASWKNKT